MSLYRKISVRMWGDARFCELTPAQPNPQTLWIYFLTGEYTTAIPGVVKGGEAAMAESLGWSVPAFRKAFEEIYAKGMAKPDWAARLVFLPNGLKHNPPQSLSVVTAWAKAFEELPECSLKVEIYHAIKLCLEGLQVGKPAAFQAAFNVASPAACTASESEAESEAETETELPARKARSRVKVDETERWFDTEFLSHYRGPHAQTQRPTALKEARKLTTKEQRDLAVANLKLWLQMPEWRKDDYQFVPGPGTFFKNNYHLNPPSSASNGNGRTKLRDAHELLEQQRREAMA